MAGRFLTADDRRGVASARLASLVALAVILLGACSIPQQRQIVPAQLINQARVVGLKSRAIRVWGDEPLSQEMIQKNLKLIRRQKRKSGLLASKRGQRVEHILVISGGGSDGAFGAGLLNGWTRTGKRPQFDVVTGVSTGALIAPFAFLGPKYDSRVKELYTRYSTEDILRPNVIAGLLGGTALTSSEPLAALIRKYLTGRIIAKIAAEHKRGRRLLVGTTNLDAERPVIWNMGEIAADGSARSRRLFRRIILASASIPGVFPPVLISVHVNGKVLQEMHVDGGTTDNTILVPIQTNLSQLDRKLNGRPLRRKLYVIVNSHLDPQFRKVDSSTIDIAGRSILTLIKQQTQGDVLKLYNFASKNRLDFNLAVVPKSFRLKRDEPFDRAYMAALFDVGKKLGAAGYDWLKSPPEH